ncbi:MAG: type II toxin-antitoxin system RelE/ParE family toxin [Spirochaetia bacterium]|nr:type II toxin-antitoxin system RelE/ParE family toxin [Spirochaetia bacterium]MCI7589592.1 type II toxin-antitoxin system RelE/ParE family toxin [Spirochaetia bacterium]
MEVDFLNKDLEELYTKGRSKKYKDVPLNIAQKMVKAVEVLKTSSSIQEIWKFPAYKFEKLQGNDRYSMRMNIVWRLELTVKWIDEKKVHVEIINLEDLIKHYGD